jgi:uncharacterized protein (TIGR04255 family)
VHKTKTFKQKWMFKQKIIFLGVMETTRKYKNPPLVEAVFEYFFSSTEWTSIIPGLFYSEIKDKFPNISQNKGGFGVTFDGKGLRIGGGNSDLTQYKNQEGNTIIQLSSNMLTVNKLPKYEGWESFIEIIINAVEALKMIINITKVERIGLKFLNKIDINFHSLENLKKYFTIYPVIPLPSENNLNSIQLNIETPIIENKEILAILLSTLQKEPNYQAPVMFQLYTTRIADVQPDYREWLEKAHLTLYDSFNQSLTAEAKNQFDNV